MEAHPRLPRQPEAVFRIKPEYLAVRCQTDIEFNWCVVVAMMALKFLKMQAAGNHFVMLDLLDKELAFSEDPGQLALTLCASHLGVGADGLLTLEAPTKAGRVQGAAVRMRMWNPDGTEDMCGNGLRCVAWLAWKRGYVTGSKYGIETLAGLRLVSKEQPEGPIRTTMGLPILDPPGVPVVRPGSMEPALNYQLPVLGRVVSGVNTLSTGSTHTVIFGNSAPSEADFLELSPAMETHAWFPERTSILWATPEGPNRFAVRIWERGVGETYACGTGACAVAVAATITGRAQEPTGAPVQVVSRGGTMEVIWEPGSQITLTGPAELVYEGIWLNPG